MEASAWVFCYLISFVLQDVGAEVVARGQCTRLLCSSIIRDRKLPTTKTFSDLLFRNVKQYKMAGVGPFQENLKTLGLNLAWTWLLLDAVVRLHVVGWGEGPWALVTPVKASRAGVGLNKKHFQLPIDT